MLVNEKNLAIVGLGNCGGQIASAGEVMYPELFECIYINTSEKDLGMCQDSELKWKIGGEGIKGSGKDRSKTKKYLEEEVSKMFADTKFINVIKNKKYVFVCASTAGGTGSGAAPVFTDAMRSMFPDVNFVLIGVLPSSTASIGENENALEFLKELCANLADNITYGLYDNDRAKSSSPTKILDEINREIIEDLRIISCVDNYPTQYESIDDADMESIVTTKGRFIIARMKTGIDEKVMEDTSMDEMIIKAIKQSVHAETNRDKLSGRWGFITYLTDACNDLYDQEFPKLQEFIGTPSEKFNHNAINSGGDNEMNFVHFIASGLLPPLDRIEKLNKRIKEQRLAQEKRHDLMSASIEATNHDLSVSRDHTRKHVASEVNIQNIFRKY